MTPLVSLIAHLTKNISIIAHIPDELDVAPNYIQPPVHFFIPHWIAFKNPQIHKHTMSSANTNTMEIESSEYVHHTIDIHSQG